MEGETFYFIFMS